MLADILLRRRDYAEPELFDAGGRYGSVQWLAVGLLVAGAVLGSGLVTNTTTAVLTWQGYLLDPFGLGGRDGAWAFANPGILVALVVGFAGTLGAGPGAGAGPGGARVTVHLAVIDMERVFGDPSSPVARWWTSPCRRGRLWAGRRLVRMNGTPSLPVDDRTALVCRSTASLRRARCAQRARVIAAVRASWVIVKWSRAIAAASSASPAATASTSARCCGTARARSSSV